MTYQSLEVSYKVNGNDYTETFHYTSKETVINIIAEKHQILRAFIQIKNIKGATQ